MLEMCDDAKDVWQKKNEKAVLPHPLRTMMKLTNDTVTNEFYVKPTNLKVKKPPIFLNRPRIMELKKPVERFYANNSAFK